MIKLTDFYYVPVDDLRKVIKERRPSKVLIQLPEGLKRLSWEVEELIKQYSRELGSELIVDIDGSPLFGSCMINLDVIKDYDLVIHMGHDPYPYTPRFSNVVYIELLSKLVLSKDLIDGIHSLLSELSVRNIALLTTQQHKNLLKTLRKVLSNDFNVLIPKNPVVTGCLIPREGKDLPNGVEAYLVIAGGSFHALGVGLSLRALKPVVRIDPYSAVVNEVSNEVRKLLMKREWRVHEACSASTWLVVSGISGQYRPYILKKLFKLLNERRLRYSHVRMPYLTINELRNVDSDYYDAIVITSCPRIPIDDISKYPKPVLTPGEAFKALGAINEYVYPW